MIDKSLHPKRGGDGLPRRLWRHALAVAMLSVAALAVMVPVASASGTPTATTEAASALSYQRATLNGTVNPDGLATTYHFEYGETTSYGTKIPVPDVFAGEGTSNVKVNQTVKGLKLGPTYHFRLAATNADGTTYGEDRTFATITSTSWAVNGQLLGSPVTVKSTGNLKFHFEKLPVLSGGGAFTVECASASEGTVASAGGGERTKITQSGCEVTSSTNSICKAGVKPTVAADDLPWRTTLVTSEGATRDQLSEDGKGAPKFGMECDGLFPAVSGFTSMSTKIVSGGVNEAFDSHSGSIESTIGGTATLEGTQLVKNPSSGILTAGQNVGEWLIAGKAPEKAVTVATKGTFKIELIPQSIYGGGYVVTKCTDANEGTVGPGGEGEATSVKLSGCEVTESTNPGCGAGAKIPVTALDLPWRTVLVTVAGTTSNMLMENGHGAPGYQLECGTLGRFSGTENNISLPVSNVTGGVEQTYNEIIQSNWSGILETKLWGGQLIESPASGTLTFK